jgi:hypothetical protein
MAAQPDAALRRPECRRSYLERVGIAHKLGKKVQCRASLGWTGLSIAPETLIACLRGSREAGPWSD